VLPEAKPVVELRVSDDYGIAELALNVEVVQSREESGAEAAGAQTVTEHQIAIDKLLKPFGNNRDGASLSGGETRESMSITFPARGEVLPIVGGFRLDLTPLQLVKGDQLRLTLKATDYRGELPGRPAESEPMILDISDESGVLAAIAEADETSEARITELIRRQLGIGESP
jgi:hypothetical protein